MNTNHWNVWRYTLYAPIYDYLIQPFRSSRQRSINLLELVAGQKVLLVGAGTGEDLSFIPQGVHITAIDITPTMVQHIKRKSSNFQSTIEAYVMDGQALTFASDSFDAVVLHLILAVIPDPIACIQEANRVLKVGGKLVIYDKFLPNDRPISWIRKILNSLTSFLFSDINRNRKQIVSNAPMLKQTHEELATYKYLNYTIALYVKDQTY